MFIDSINVIGVHATLSEAAALREHQLLQAGNQELPRIYAAWFYECRKIGYGGNEVTYNTQTPAWDEFSGTMTNDREKEFTLLDQKVFCDTINFFANLHERRFAGVFTLDDLLQTLARFDTRYSAVVLGNIGHHLCRTSEGRLGWMPIFAEKGDMICIFDGAKTPHVLKRTQGGQYMVFGDRYVRGIQKGEAMQIPELRTETIALA